eukprot:NODE_547_length_6851_cov_0.322867.p3 type:complete len:349 gc:universal NODE_547_length_6851_cov_0.322867:1465-2511(+)
MTVTNWDSILESSSTLDTVPHSKLLLLGDSNSGKSTFIQNTFQTNPTTDILMSYNYYTHRDPDTNDILMDADVYSISKDLPINIELLVKEFSLDTICCIFLSWDEPELFLHSIQKWLKFLLNVVDVVVKRRFQIENINSTIFIPNESFDKKAYLEIENARTKLKRTLQLLKESQSRDWTLSQDLSKLDVIPLNNGSLAVNLGIHIVLVLSKSDLTRVIIDKLELTSSKLEFMLQAIRKVALTVGAAIFSIDNTLEKQTTLYEYLLYRQCPFVFQFSKEVDGISIDRLAIPSGWDSLDKIKSISNASNLDESFLVQIEYENNTHLVKISGHSHYKQQFPEKMQIIDQVF